MFKIFDGLIGLLQNWRNANWCPH